MSAWLNIPWNWAYIICSWQRWWPCMEEEILDADGRIDIGKFELVAYVYPRSEYWTLGEPLRKPQRKSGLRKGKKE